MAYSLIGSDEVPHSSLMARVNRSSPPNPEPPNSGPVGPVGRMGSIAMRLFVSSAMERDGIVAPARRIGSVPGLPRAVRERRRVLPSVGRALNGSTEGHALDRA